MNNFQKFVSNACDSVYEGENNLSENNNDSTLPWIDFEEFNTDASQALSYVSGYLVKKLKLPDENCSKCQTDLFCMQQKQHHLYTVFKEYLEKDSLTYPSDNVMTLLQNIHERLFYFFNENGHKSNLELTFKKIFFNNYNSEFCLEHRCDNMIVENSLSFFIHKYVKDKNKNNIKLTSGHYEKTKQFKSL